MAFELSNLFGSKEKPELDQFEKALGELREKLETKSEDVFNKLKTAFLKDLDELKITDEAQRESLWEGAKKAVEGKLLNETPEAKALSAFVDDVENYPMIKEAIKNQKPMAKVKGKLKESGMLGATAFALETWIKESQKKDPDSWLAKVLQKLLDYFNEDSKEPSQKTEQDAAKPSEVPPLAEWESVNALIKEKQLKMDPITELQLTANPKLKDQITSLMNDTKFILLKNAIETDTRLNNFKFIPEDFALTPAQMEQISLAIGNQETSAYKPMNELTPEIARNFMNSVRTGIGIQNYLKQSS
ncbi:hypothetical protein IPJ72_01465 [Candidatus Peregrinibacteria bacterium]|nr:MAG: hypothetical protein IPJ72_01465 [Candidatus Peregrinibacteria bacterium]